MEGPIDTIAAMDITSISKIHTRQKKKTRIPVPNCKMLHDSFRKSDELIEKLKEGIADG